MKTRPTELKVIFDGTTNEPTETAEPNMVEPPRVNEIPQRGRTEPIHAAMIEKALMKVPTPKVQMTQTAKMMTPT